MCAGVYYLRGHRKSPANLGDMKARDHKKCTIN